MLKRIGNPISSKWSVARPTDELNTILLHMAGAEVPIAESAYSKEEMLTFKSMDVYNLRKEAEELSSLLGNSEIMQGRPIRSIDFKLALANNLPPSDFESKEALVSALKSKYPNIDANQIGSLIQLDIDRYGKDPALAITQALCYGSQPFLNILYLKDNALKIKNGKSEVILLANMANSIRQGEEDLVKLALEGLGYHRFYKTQSPLEAGDHFGTVNGNGCWYYAFGIRTHKESIKELQDVFKIPIIGLEIPYAGDFVVRQQQMHGDVVMSFPKEGFLYTSRELFDEIRAVHIGNGADTTAKKHFEAEGFNIRYIPESERRNLAVNMGVIRNGLVLSDTASYPVTCSMLAKDGIRVINGPLKEARGGFGWYTCTMGLNDRSPIIN